MSLDKKFDDLRLDAKLMKDSKKVFDQITSNHLSYLVRLQNDEINRDFPEDIPARLLWPGKSLLPKTEKRAPIKQELLGLVEAEEFTENTPRQRQKRKRYAGTYNVESLAASTSMVVARKPNESLQKRKVSESSMTSSTSKASSSLSSVATLTLSTAGPKSTRKLPRSSSSSSSSSCDTNLLSSASSTSSSSDSFDEEISNKSKTPGQTRQKAHKAPKLMKVSCQLALNNSKVLQPNPKQLALDVSHTSVVLPKEPEKLVEGAKVEPSKPVPVAVKVAEKPPVIKTQPKKFEKPKLVEAPQMDPKTNKPITKETLDKQKLKKIPRIPKKVNTTQSLGGEEQPKPTSPVLVVSDAISTSPVQVIKPRPVENSVPRKPRSPIRAPAVINFVKEGETETSESGTDKFNRRREPDDTSSDEEIPGAPTKTVLSSSSSSSSESEDGGKPAEETANRKPEPKEAQNEDSASSSEGQGKAVSSKVSSTKKFDVSDFEDVVLLDNDIELDFEYDDDLDISSEPPKSLATQKADAAPKLIPKTVSGVSEGNYSAGLDQPKLTLTKEDRLRITAPKEVAESDVDLSTDEITSKIAPPLDTPALRILQQFFGNICIDFLKDSCLLYPCKHYLPEVLAVAERLDRCALKPIDDAFNLALNFPAKLLFPYFGLFAEQFTKKALVALGDESRLARMIMECEKNARSHTMYRTVADALVTVAQMPLYKATRFIMKFHTDSPYAREVITQMIIDTGPDLIRNINYLQGIEATQTVPIPTVDKIMSNCITYQDPALPNFCLKLLMSLQPKQLSELRPENLTKFINLQAELSASNYDREMKVAHVATVVAQLPKKKPPPNV